jgi:ketosteroid isomerase-like protein
MDDVGTCEEALRLAMLTSDVETLNRLIDDELVFYDHAGRHVTKAMDLAMHRSGRLKITTLDFTETMIDVEGPVAVVMTRAILAGSFDGEDFAGDFRYMRIWRRMDDESWRIAFAQCTAVAA